MPGRFFSALAVGALLAGGPVRAEVVRLAVFGAALSREGPGLLLRDIDKEDDAQIAATLAIVADVAPDILVLTEIDWDLQNAALLSLRDRMRPDYPFVFAAQPNAGLPSGLDLDENGYLGDARDAQGYGRFRGDGGVAVLSRYPLDVGGMTDFTPLLWRDLPGGSLDEMLRRAPSFDRQAQEQRRLSSTVHWVLPVQVPGGTVDLAVWAATPPVFDGPEDANGLRNRDELLLWRLWIDGAAGLVPGQAARDPARPFILMGNANLDPADGAGYRDAMADFLTDPRVSDPRPASPGATLAADADHAGDPALDTADWTGAEADGDGPGNLRVSYVLPSADLTIAGSGVFWPAPDDPLAAVLGEDGLRAGPHRLVWVDIEF